MSRKLGGIFAALALAAVPGIAQAHQSSQGLAHGQGQGRDHAPGLHRERSGDQQGTSKSEGKAHPFGQSHRKARVAWMARGTVKAVDATAQTITISVFDKKGATNRHARDWRGTDVTFDVSDARLKVRDVNGDGERNLSDVAVGDFAKVLAKLPRMPRAQQSTADGTTSGDQVYKAKWVRVRHAEQPAPEQEPQTGSAQEPQTAS
jgi:hypothetical protein